MIDNITSLPYPVFESIIKYLNDEDVEQLSYVNKIIHEEIMNKCVLKQKIKYNTLKRSTLLERKEIGLYRGYYGRSYELLGRSLCIDHGLIIVNIPMAFMDEVEETGAIEIITQKNTNIKSFLDIKKEYNLTTFYLHGLEIMLDLRHRIIMELLLELSERCEVKRRTGHERIFVYNWKLVFTITYTNYIEVFNRIRSEE